MTDDPVIIDMITYLNIYKNNMLFDFASTMNKKLMKQCINILNK